MNRNTENIYLGKICTNICSIHFGIYSIELNRKKSIFVRMKWIDIVITTDTFIYPSHIFSFPKE